MRSSGDNQQAEMIAPDDRVFAVSGSGYQERQVWAIGGVRASMSRLSQRKWTWRVWMVVGGMTLTCGTSRTKKEGEVIVLVSLRAATGIMSLTLPD